MPETTRFAPSPSGQLHLGHAYAALFAARAAQGGRFLLRLEDIDRSRCRAEFETALLEDLAWLGLRWEAPPLRQSERLTAYRDALERLRALGLVYPCFCTRRAIAEEIARADSAPHGPDGPLYPGLCRDISERERRERLAAGESHAWRLDVEAARRRCGPLTWLDLEAGEQVAQPELLGDVVLARKDVPTSYHLAVVVDDAAQEITLVTRGVDLFHATHMHRLLQALLELPVPRWHHHRLITDADGERLAKRHNALSLRALRAACHSPAEVRAMVGMD
ncbi:tRNA glutamyl-Q(34) synthetase GluQRS [Aquibaculum arenosum]|uniref:tRNA glutamyl-Q(34) synthetase GluQRS n=1 Tax=Aquibaculum arenosum TaxID=3032591 RepID=A0ABT5YPZ1_9PROT|nr:tRNA glutamyl-Q(34) synthetase GluQRS [Fodinicurvata sp. CAU 1616]MDF2097039.1 tRNA glutamyl-Q(34) synthetase GluQRS [Fodinicurvata sp. CAU 1616]